MVKFTKNTLVQIFLLPRVIKIYIYIREAGFLIKKISPRRHKISLVNSFSLSSSSQTNNKSRLLLLLMVVCFVLGLHSFIFWTSPQGLTLTKKLFSMLDGKTIFFILYIISITALIYLIIRFTKESIKQQPKYLVEEFRVDNRSPNLQSVGNLVRDTLVKDIQKISSLLSSSQTEPLSGQNQNSFSQFITSSYESDFISQINTISEITLSSENVKIPLGGIGRSLIKNLTDVRLTGSVTLDAHRHVTVWVNLYLRKSKVLAEGSIQFKEHELNKVSPYYIQNRVRDLAVQLLRGLGNELNLASSEESFKIFLSGLEASVGRKWWLAINDFRKVVDIEESSRGLYSLGHYHLGAAYINQGDRNQGLSHLEISQISGPPNAKTEYMLALAKLIANWGKLHHEKNSSFAEIESHIEIALALSPDFPEADHLLGTALYKKGRLIEKHRTKRHHVPGIQLQIVSDKSKELYLKGYISFKKAIRGYKNKRGKLKSDNFTTTKQKDFIRFAKDELTSRHQLADSFRALECFKLAELHYKDILDISSEDFHSQIDLVMTYSLFGEWEKLETWWDEKLKKNAKWFWQADIYIFIARMYFQKLSERTNEIQDLPKAFGTLDFAIHQRPQYIARWRQTDWAQEITAYIKKNYPEGGLENKAVGLLEGKKAIKDYDIDDHFVSAMIWIGNRIDSYSYSHDHSKEDDHLMGKVLKPILNAIQNNSSFAILYSFHKEIKAVRYEYLKKTVWMDKRKQRKGIQNAWLLVSTVEKILKLWGDLQKEMEKESNSEVEIDVDINYRWKVDLVAECSLLAAKLLMEFGANRKAYEVATESLTYLMKFVDRWRQQFKESDNKRYFSPKIIKFQISSLQLLSALLLMRISKSDGLDNYCIEAEDNAPAKNSQETIVAVKELLGKAKPFFKDHPFYDFVEAKLYQYQELYSLSNQKFYELEKFTKTILNSIEPFANQEFNGGPDIFASKSDTPKEGLSLQDILGYQEKISGRRQFEDYLNASNIYQELAYNFEKSGEDLLAVDNLLEASVYSSNIDLDSNIFGKMSRSLIRLERFDEAQAISLAEIELRESNNFNDLSFVNKATHEINEIMILTRSNRQGSANVRAKKLATGWKPLEFDYIINNDLLTDLHPEFSGEKDKDSLSDLFESVHTFMKDISEHVKDVVDSNEEFPKEIQNFLHMLSEEGRTQHGDEIKKPPFRQYLTKPLMGSPSQQKEELRRELQKKVDEDIFLFSESPFDIFPPKIFKEFREEEYLREETKNILLANWFSSAYCYYALQSKQVSEFPKQFNAKLFEIIKPKTFSEKIIIKKILYFFLSESTHYLENTAALLNIFAYSKANADTNLHYSIKDSLLALDFQSALLNFAKIDKINDDYWRYRLLFAQYSDTLGWAVYRVYKSALQYKSLEGVGVDENVFQKGAFSYLEAASNILEYGLKYYQNRAILYYHLARIHMTWLTNLWHVIPNKKKPSEMSVNAYEINLHLSKIKTYIKNAKENDISRNIYGQLINLEDRAMIFQKKWDKYQFAFISDHDLTMPKVVGDSPPL